MGMLVEGKWTDKWYDTKSTGGRFKRKESTFRNWIRAYGSTDFQPRADGTISTCPLLAHGLTVP